MSAQGTPLRSDSVSSSAPAVSGIWLMAGPVREPIQRLLLDLLSPNQPNPGLAEALVEELGRVVMDHLQRLDPVAYVRFASVYRQFKDIGQFVEEVKGLQRDDKAKPAPAAKPRPLAKTK